MKFKVGDKVKLKNYDEYEYPDYRDQEAVIIGFGGGENLNVKIQWKDSYISFASNNNLFITNSKTKPMGRKKYILLKETDFLKKGAIFEEMCDDGTQDFTLITPEFKKFPKADTATRNREIVINNPKWFAEVTVFYLTKEMVKKLGKKLKI